MVFLELLFDDFGLYFNGKLRWSRTKRSKWTDMIWEFFSERNQAESIPYIEIKEHMRVDYIWRYDTSRYSTYNIALAVEHEAEERRVEVLVNEEVQHLIDLKAEKKIGIFYPARGDEKELIEKIQKRIAQSMTVTSEEYLIILGYATTKGGKRVILLRGFFLNKNGELEKTKEHIISQKLRSSV